MPDATVEYYLARLRQELATLPAGRRDEEIREIGEHLGQLVDALRAGGMERHAAVATAVERFGPVERIGRRLRAAHRIRSPWRRLARVMVVAVTLMLAATLGLLLVVALTPVPVGFLDSSAGWVITHGVPLLLAPIGAAAVEVFLRQWAERD